jgi:hypothetical protein
MHFSPIALQALFAAVVSAAATPRAFNCGTPEPDQEHVKISQKFAAQEKEFIASGNFSIAATINVDVYFHVVASSTAVKDGYVTVSPTTTLIKGFCILLCDVS